MGLSQIKLKDRTVVCLDLLTQSLSYIKKNKKYTELILPPVTENVALHSFDPEGY